MNRKALVVGIDDYANVSSLHGCVNDSLAVKAMLDRHADGSVNFGVKPVVSQRFSEERELLRFKFRMFVGVGWCK
jgi:hypothetical protein